MFYFVFILCRYLQDETDEGVDGEEVDGGGVEGEDSGAGEDKKPVESKLDARLQVCQHDVHTSYTHTHTHAHTHTHTHTRTHTHARTHTHTHTHTPW